MDLFIYLGAPVFTFLIGCIAGVSFARWDDDQHRKQADLAKCVVFSVAENSVHVTLRTSRGDYMLLGKRSDLLGNGEKEATPTLCEFGPFYRDIQVDEWLDANTGQRMDRRYGKLGRALERRARGLLRLHSVGGLEVPPELTDITGATK
jgi:hypothetical protein